VDAWLSRLRPPCPQTVAVIVGGTVHDRRAAGASAYALVAVQPAMLGRLLDIERQVGLIPCAIQNSAASKVNYVNNAYSIAGDVNDAVSVLRTGLGPRRPVSLRWRE